MNRVRWSITGAVIAAAAVCAAVVAWREPRDPLVRLARAAGKFDTRITEARLSGFAFQPISFRPRARDSAHLRFRALVGEVLQSTAHDDHAAGVAVLLLGANDDAVKRLTACAETHPTDASVWNDLAAARYTAANANDDPQQLVSALAAADHALRIAPIVEAKFNRALILESLGLHAPAVAQYALYARTAPEEEGTGEARARASRLQRPTAADRWNAALPRLRQAAKDGDLQRAVEIISDFRQEARTTSQTLLLLDWADATLCGDPVAATRALRVVSATAEALRRLNGDTMLLDAVSAARSCGRCARLASAQSVYVRARLLYRDRRVAESRPLFEEAAAEFATAESPLKLSALYYVAFTYYDENHDKEAADLIARLLRETPQSYRSLRAEILWVRDNIETRRGRYYEALATQEEALGEFRTLRERLNIIAMTSQAAAIQSLLGRAADAWRMRRELFGAVSDSGDALELQRAISLAARSEALAGEWAQAYSLLTVAADRATSPNARVLTSTLVWAALTANHLGLSAAAQKHLDAGRRVAASLVDPAVKVAADAELLFVQASLCSTTDARLSKELFGRYIQIAETGGSVLLLPEALMARAHASRLTGDLASAAHDLAIAQQRLTVPHGKDAPFAEALFHASEAVATETMEVCLALHDTRSAFAAIDRWRSTEFPTSATDVTTAPMASDMAIIEFALGGSRPRAFVKERTGIRVVTLPGTREQLRTQCAAAIDVSGKLGDACSQALAAVFDTLPITVHNVAVIPDEALTSVPWSALRVHSKRYLIEEYELTVSPSCGVALSPGGPWKFARDRFVTIIANPALDPHHFPELPPLPAANSEAAAIAAVYDLAVVLLGQSATRPAVVNAAAKSTILHIAAHALPIARDPRLSALPLAPAPGEPDTLTVAEIQKAAFDQRPLVVLSGCNTATVGASRSSVSSLAAAFLAAGAPNVIGTLRNVDDSDASAFGRLLHHELAQDKSAAAALRSAQLQMLYSADLRLRKPACWASFQTYGAVARETDRSIRPFIRRR